MQTIDWQDPTQRRAVRGLYLRYALWQAKFTIFGLLVLLVVGLYDGLSRQVWAETWMAATVGVLVCLRVVLHVMQLNRTMAQLGVVHYSVTSQGLVVQNQRGQFDFPWERMQHAFSGREGMIVRFDRRLLTIPNGPVRTEIARVLGR